MTKLIAGVLCAGLAGYTVAVPMKPVVGELVTVKKSGGRTVHGLYQMEFSIKSDGTVTIDGLKKGKLATASLKSLQTRIASTNFSKIKSKRFGGTRPSAYDGTDVVYIFRTPKGTATVANYLYVIDPTMPLFTDLEELMRSYANP